ncbi:TSUP family transporter [Candidatus Poribacteria bacterium]|nr:TSUP family transporter [Candidatus Poribacteria bacterium]
MDFGSFTDIIIRLGLGFGIGITIGLTGIGIVLVMPSLLYILNLSPVAAVGTGLLYSVLTRSIGAFEHFRLGTVRKRTALYIIIGGVPAVILTSYVINHFSKAYGSGIDYIMKIIITIAILATWMLMLYNLIKGRKNTEENYYTPAEKFPFSRKLYGFFAGTGVGTLIGATSIGGGVMIVPILGSVFQLSPNNTVGTSVFIGIVMSVVGSFAYLLGGSMDVVVAVTMFIGSLPGVFIGSRISVKIPHKVLSIILFIVITASVVAMFAGIRR